MQMIKIKSEGYHMYEKDWVKRELSDVAIADDRIVNRIIKTTEVLSMYLHL